MAFETLKRVALGAIGRDPLRQRATAHYRVCAEAARRPGFYEKLGVPDTVDGRFDMLALHVFLVLRQLRGAGGVRDPLGQAIFDVMFRDMDDQLRELGVGDLKVSKKVRGLAEDFLGRAGAYEAAFAKADDEALAAALARNVYEDEEADAQALATFARRADAALADQDIRGGNLSFPAPFETEGATP